MNLGARYENLPTEVLARIEERYYLRAQINGSECIQKKR